jgi:hypothetical protein
VEEPRAYNPRDEWRCEARTGEDDLREHRAVTKPFSYIAVPLHVQPTKCASTTAARERITLDWSEMTPVRAMVMKQLFSPTYPDKIPIINSTALA